MKRLVALAAALAISGSALASPGNPTLTIRHQLRGCHSWSFDGTSWKASQSAVIARGHTITVVDNDVMPHKLVQLAGPKAKVTGSAMSHLGAAARILFPTKGTYVFATRAGEDYTKGVKTIGEDNVLRLVVRVV